MSLERALLGAAIVIAVISLIFSGYVLSSISERIEANRELLKTLEERLAESPRASDIEDLQGRIESLEERLSNVATLDDLAGIALEIERLSRDIESLSSSLQSANKSLLLRVDELRERLERVEESIRFPVTVIDGSGEEVVIASRPERIVTLVPSATEIVYFVGAADRIVGTDSFSDFPPEIREKRERGEIVDVGGAYTQSPESVLAADPDIVFGSASIPAHYQIKEALKAHGIPVILLPDSTLEDIVKSLLIAGTATGNVVEAARAAVEFEALVSRIEQAAMNLEPARVALVVWVNPIFVAGGGTWQNDMIGRVGGVNVFANITGWPQVSPEALLETAPDVIIVTNSKSQSIMGEELLNVLQSTLGDAINEIPAVSEGLVFTINGTYEDLLVRPSPRAAMGLALLLYILHPNLFGEDYAAIPRLVDESTLPEIPLPSG
ncbi:MAG: helical backbone metal receptor [Desulfurococcales archaeon]|nr:helical backbone metal receptor [Desulfurococcales archaeon]